ncbi:hypothetical protein CHLRE_12g552100v5 [Chlamydomonas reinhardtii]|uniref:Uncharacterized protein n=1 Tax=Chlamydomonas reinhardtii TaxID=3055 RepID=A0A2K3D623_CHLRE|nr:uncharacterized protein CHLRE_12g552100v5 [Chlamydomonas reinhardtii]PNW75986.1 hypothetical protein CHLRE_12g552100v5 [Chlamydomonas reinhardtii]
MAGPATLVVLLVCSLGILELNGVQSAPVVKLHRNPPPRRANSPHKGRPPAVRVTSPPSAQSPAVLEPPSPAPGPPPASPPPRPPQDPPASPFAPPPDYGPTYTLRAQTAAVRFFQNNDDFGLRVDLAVPNPAAPTTKVWAPWCATQKQMEQRVFVGSIVSLLCKAALPESGGGFIASDSAWAIPTGPVPTGMGYLNPAEYKAWVFIPDEKLPGADVAYDKTTIDLSLFKVMTTPCESGLVLVANCVFLGRR